MTVTATQVKELREKTGAGMMDAKNALTEAGGDMEKAADLLRQKGIATAEKKSGRITAEGLVHSQVSSDAKHGALLEINCETDFVAKGDAFQAVVNEIAQHVLAQAPADTDALLQQTMSATGQSVQEYITDKIGQIKENITVRRFVVYNHPGAGRVHSYIHIGGKIGVLLEVSAQQAATANNPDFQQLVKDIAMQIASAAPEFASRDEISPDVIAKETEVEMGKEDIQNKPPEIREKIVAGRVDKLLAQRVLLEQPFVKDPSQTIGDLLKASSAKLEDTLQVVRFTRYVLGEGIEKKQSNFAEEVMAQVK